MSELRTGIILALCDFQIKVKLVLQNEQNSDKVQWAFRKSAAKQPPNGQTTNLLFQNLFEAREVCADSNGREIPTSHRLLRMIWHLAVTCLGDISSLQILLAFAALRWK